MSRKNKVDRAHTGRTLFDLSPPPSSGDHGQGATTEYKERCIQHAMSVNLRICAQGAKYHSRFPYWHFDMHSGSGWNKRVNCIGTPLAFLAEAERWGKKYHAFFCDKNKKAIEVLNERPEIASNNRCYLFAANNREVLPVFAEYIRQSDKPDYAMGTVICDPNGYLHPSSVPLELLSEFCSQFPRIDLILNLNVRTLQMMRPHVRRGLGKWGALSCPELDEFPALFNRSFWLLRKVIQSSGDRFVLMIGRNFRLGDARGFGFYHMDSPEGQGIIGETKGRPDEIQELRRISEPLGF